MSLGRRGEVSILFGDHNRGMRALYRAALRSEGFVNLHEFDTLESFAALLKQVRPDLIFMEATMPGGNAIAATRAIRHGEIGEDPFVPIILATWEAERGMVRRIIDSGADDLLVKPLSTQAISGRIAALAQKRKPFVVTADYIGPDRRAGPRSDNDAPLIVVPNGLRIKLEGQPIDDEDFRLEIAGMREQVNLLRLKASAFRIAFAAVQLDDLRRTQPTMPEDAGILLRGMLDVLDDIRLRIGQAGRDAVLVLCSQLAEPVGALLQIGTLAAAAELWQNLFPVIQSRANALLQYFHPNASAAQLHARVESAVQRFRERAAAIEAGALPGDAEG